MEFGENGSLIRHDVVAADTYLHQHSNHGYAEGPRPVARLYELMRFGLFGYIVTEFIHIALYATIFLFPDTMLGNQTRALEFRQLAFLLAELAYVAGAVIAFFCACRFIYRTMRNLHTIQSPAAKISPVWSVGYYFIPIANLFMPANALSQIYHGTHEAVGESSRHASPVPLWWTPWLISGIPETIADNLGVYGFGALTLHALSSALGITAALMLIRIGKRIADRQQLLKHGGIATVFD